jgi:hypothetical protein
MAEEHLHQTIGIGSSHPHRLTAGDANITEAGGIGLWTKADAASAFDDVEVSSAD